MIVLDILIVAYCIWVGTQWRDIRYGFKSLWSHRTGPWFEFKYDFWKASRGFTRPYYKTKQFVKNFIFWLPILWDDAWFDGSYLLHIIERKCRRDSYEFYNHGIAMDHKEIAYELMEAAEICHRLQDEHESYWEPAYSNHRAKWHPYTDLGDLDSLVSEERTEAEHAEFRAIMVIAEAKEQADYNRLGYLMSRINFWWD
jgi:hypothetical protein